MTTTELLRADRERCGQCTCDDAPPPSTYLAYGDPMRVLGVLAVLLVHTCDMILFARPVGSEGWDLANVLDAAGRWAVPVFIMLSGALLLHPSRVESARAFYRRRLTRLGTAVVFWSVFFMTFSVLYTGWGSVRWDAPNSIWRGVLHGAPYVHLHFVFRLLGLYAITPMLRVYVRHASLRLRTAMAVLVLGLGMGHSIIAGVLGVPTTAFTSLWPFLGLYLLGNVMRDLRVTRRMAGIAGVGFAACVALMAGGTRALVGTGELPQAYPSVDMLLYDFLNPVRVAMAICAWLVFAGTLGGLRRESRSGRVFAALAPLTLGVYLVHPLFREILYTDGWRLIPGVRDGGELFRWPTPAVGIPLVFAVTIVASFATTWLLARIPFVRKVVG